MDRSSLDEPGRHCDEAREVNDYVQLYCGIRP
jgi:hypothetical protein